jgi:hypothetical protein
MVGCCCPFWHNAASSAECLKVTSSANAQGTALSVKLRRHNIALLGTSAFWCITLVDITSQGDYGAAGHCCSLEGEMRRRVIVKIWVI